MLLRFLSLAAVLTSVTASLPDHQIPNTPQSRHLYKIDIPCSRCAFADVQCPQPESKPYITLDLSTDNGTLYANHMPIFPPTLPLQFPATKRWDSGEQSVVVAYGIDARPLPSQPGAVLGETLLLNLRLFDLHGRPITPDLVAVGLVSHDRTLRITKVERSPFRRHSYASSPWRLFASHVKPYLNLDALAGAAHDHPTPSHRRPRPRPDGLRKSPAYHYHNTMPWSSRDRSFMRLVRPVILPALLGVAAGLLVCLLGFVAGRVMVALYLFFREREVPAGTESEEEGLISEKERLELRWSNV